MIVVAIIALLASIAVPGFLRARKRSQASRVMTDMRLLDHAIDQYAIEKNKSTGNKASFSDLKVYLKKSGVLYNTGKDILSNTYGTAFTVDFYPRSMRPPAPRSPMSPTPPTGRLTLNHLKAALSLEQRGFSPINRLVRLIGSLF